MINKKTKQLLSYYDTQGGLDACKKKEYNENYQKILTIKDSIKQLEEKRKEIAGYLKTHGEGEVCVIKRMYPNCTLYIKKNMLQITTLTSPIVYFIQDGALKQV